MVADRQSLQRDFQLLKDAALIALVRSGGLTELAQDVAAAELRRRGIAFPLPAGETAGAESPPIADDLVPVAQLFTVEEAHMLQSRLEMEGVPAMVADANFVQVYPLLSVGVGGVRVLVPTSYLDRARAIARAISRGDYALDDKANVG